MTDVKYLFVCCNTSGWKTSNSNLKLQLLGNWSGERGLGRESRLRRMKFSKRWYRFRLYSLQHHRNVGSVVIERTLRYLSDHKTTFMRNLQSVT